MIQVHSGSKGNSESIKASSARLTLDCAQMDEATIRYLKSIAARRGIGCQALIRMWAKGRLEVEMRKMFV